MAYIQNVPRSLTLGGQAGWNRHIIGNGTWKGVLSSLALPFSLLHNHDDLRVSLRCTRFCLGASQPLTASTETENQNKFKFQVLGILSESESLSDSLSEKAD